MRARKTFVKKSVKRRDEVKRAIYRQEMQLMEESL
jgi:hypothetical protein